MDKVQSYKVVKSAVNSDHKAVIAYTGATKVAHAYFLSQLSQLQYQSDYSSDTQTKFNHFYRYLESLLDSFYPERTTTITSREPIYVHDSSSQGSPETEEPTDVHWQNG